MVATLLRGLFKPNSFVKNTSLFLFLFLSISFFSGFISEAHAQDALIKNKGQQSICFGESTSLEVIIGASVGPYTVIYSDGTTSTQVDDYASDGDIESPTYGGDAINISPNATTTYSLVSVQDKFGTYLPVDAATIIITVNPLPSDLLLTSPTESVCSGVSFDITATATGADHIELWDSPKTALISNLPYTVTLTADMQYTIVAVSSAGCSIEQVESIVIDNEDPVAICKPFDLYLNASGEGTLLASDVDNSSTDNCGITQRTLSKTNFTCADLGAQNVTLTVEDAKGNTNSCNATVTVIDNIDPTITGTTVSSSLDTDSGECDFTVVGATYDPTAFSDNCSVSILTYTINGGTPVGTDATTSLSGATLNKGANEIVWTAKDASNNTATWSYTITIADNEEPAITNCPADQNLNISAGTCDAVLPNYIDLLSIVATDNCSTAGNIILTQSPIAGSVLSGGHGATQLITISAEDESGKIGTCTFTVNVVDTQDPTIVNLPSPIVKDSDSGECGALVSWTEPTSDDNCSGHSIAQTAGLAKGTEFPIGVTTVTYTATDAAGRTYDESFTVTVNDTELPSISCPANITADASVGNCGVVVNYTAPVGTDNCPGATTVQIAGLAPGAEFPVGETTNTFRVTDAAGNTTDCSFTVTVSDVENPSIIDLPENITVDNDAGDCGAIVSWTEPTSSDNCAGDNIVQSAGSGSGSVFPVGISTISYTATDAAGNDVVESFTITVNDNEKPIISNCPSGIVRTSDEGVCTANVSWTEPTATDNCSSVANLVWAKSHEPGDDFSVGETTVTYTATDEKGNVSTTCSFTVTVTDDQKPILSDCPSNIVINNTNGLCTGIASWTEPTATDNCAGTLSWNKSHLPGASFPSGTTTVIYTAEDQSGNVSDICSFTVKVVDNEDPVASCIDINLPLDASGLATLNVGDINNSSSDNCTASGDLVLSLSQTSFNCSDKGENIVTLTVKDAAGRTSTCDATVTVVDIVKPVISPTSGTVTKSVNTNSGDCFYSVNGAEFDPIVSDNCSGTVLSYTVSGASILSGTGSLAGQQLNKGANVITWTALDASNNSEASGLGFTITVLDNQAPIISATTNKNRGTDTNCGYTAKSGEFDVSITDNCSVSSQTYTINGGTAVNATSLDGVVFQKGTNSVVWTASDGTNTSTRTFQVTVEDDDLPVITQISDILQNVDAGECDAQVNWTEPVATDNCPSVNLSRILGPASGSTFQVGTTQIRYRAVDASGLVTYMTFNVTVADQTPPELTCPVSTLIAPFERDADNAGCFYTVVGTEFNPVATDECNLMVTNDFDGSSTLEGKKIPTGEHEIIWTATDGVNTTSCSVFVKVTDTQDPTFTQPTGLVADSYTYSYETDPGQCYFTVSGTDFDLSEIVDNCDYATPTYVITKNGVEVFTGSNTIANTQFPKDEIHDYSVVWTLSDINGNTVTSAPFTISITDAQAPSFVCYGNEVRSIPTNSCEYTIVGTEFDPTELEDNCDDIADLNISYTLDGVSGGASTSLVDEILAVGDHDVVWTVVDASGNTETCSFTITIEDNAFPVVSAVADQEKDAPADVCHYKVVGTDYDPLSVTDNCGIASIVNNQNNTASLNGFEFPVGVTVVVWKATDNSGNVTIMQYQFKVNDISSPSFNVPATASKSTASNSCVYTVVGAEFDPTDILDNCTPDNFGITNDWNNYKTLAYEEFPVGTTDVVWTVSDYYGNSLTKTISITVTDDTDPVISCPTDPYTRVVDYGQNYYTVGANEFKPIASDNCSLTYTNNITGTSTLTGEQLSPATHNIVWTATDAAGNETTCTVVVNVIVDLYPSITCVGDQSKSSDTGECEYTAVGTEFDATSTSAGATLTHDYAPAASNTTLSNAVFPYGTTLVKWTATQTVDGEVYTNDCSFYVSVYDNELPVLTHAGDLVIPTNSGCYATGVDLGIPTRTDNCGVSDYWNNAPSSYPIGVTNVTWRIRDIHNNYNTVVQTVTVLDDDAPTFNCPSLCREIDQGQTYYTVFDHEFDPSNLHDCSGYTKTHNIQTTDSGALPYAPNSTTLAGAKIPEGVNSITWTVTDNASPTPNSATCTSTITIYNNDPPSVTCRGNSTKVTDPGLCSYEVQGVEFDVTSTTSGTTLTYILTGVGAEDTDNNTGTSLDGVALKKGTTTVSWIATNGADTNECCTFNVYVYDNEDPVVTWPADVTVNVDAGSCTATNVVLGVPTATDNCDDPSEITSWRTPTGTTFDIGTTNVYWTARDTRGNHVYHTQKVTVNDNISPVIDCPSDTYYREFNNLYVDYYTSVGSEFKPDVADNCTLASYQNDKTNSSSLNGTRFTIGDHAVIWTATDQGGNTDNCTVNITIVDSFDPLMDCPNTLYESTASDACTYTHVGGSYDAAITNLSIIIGRTLVHNIQTADSGVQPYAPSNTTLDGAVFPKGSTTVVWTGTQVIGGNTYSSTCSHQVVVTDEVAPVILPLPADLNLFVDAGTCVKTTTLTNPVATDNCTNQGDLVITNDAPSPFLIGTTNVRWEISDEVGNKTVYVQKVTVTDNEGPVITNCPSTITLQASGSNCQAVVDWPALIATDDCSGMKSFASTHAPGSLFNVGTTTVTYTATDNNDNISTCVFDVVVTDIDPTIACIADQERDADDGTCSYLVLGNEFDPVSFDDNCSVNSVEWSFTDAVTGLPRTGVNTLSGVEIPRGSGAGATGETDITWTVTDAMGNTSACTFTLTIKDKEAPIIVVLGNQVKSTDLNKNYYTVQGDEFDEVTAFDNCGIVTKLVNEFNIASLDGRQLAIGENTITWYAEDDSGNRSEAQFYVTVVDNEPPVLLTAALNTSTGNDVTTCQAVVNYTPPVFIDYGTTDPAVTVTVSPADATSGSIFPVGDTEVTYIAVDGVGNQLTHTFTVTVSDTEDPVISCPSGSPFSRNTTATKSYYLTPGTEFDPTFSDNCSASITNDFNNSNTLKEAHFPVGTTDVVWTATDEAGNSVNCSIQIIVTDNENPTITNCPSETVAKNADIGACSFEVPGAEFDPYGFTDNNGLQKLTYQIGSGAEIGTDLTTTLAGVQIPVGIVATPTTTITWRLYDTSNNISATCTTVFTISDVEAPTVTTVANQTRTTDSGEAYYTVVSGDNWNPVVTDNCDVAKITYKIGSDSEVGTDINTTIVGAQIPVGITEIVWTATDVHGNTNTGRYLVTVNDEEAPSITCNNITVQLDASGNYSLDTDDINAIGSGSSDPSGIASMQVSPNSFSCNDVGNNSVVLTVTDIFGNISTCNTAVVLLEDATPPNAICNNITIQLDVLGQASILSSQLDGGSTDACGIQSVSAAQTTFDCSDVGANTVVVTVTDINGNASTCDATVTVEDNNAPSAVCSPLTITLDATGNYTLTSDNVDAISLGSTDNCNLTKTVTPSVFDCTNIGSNAVTLKVTDPQGNFDECETTITVVDNTNPIAICQDIIVQLDSDGLVAITANQVDNGSNDACGIASLSLDKTSFDCSNKGDNTVILTVIDNNGNTATCSATVTVEDNVNPVVSCIGDQSVNTDTDVCTYTHTDDTWNATSTDACGTVSILTYKLTGATDEPLAQTNLNGQTFNKGITTVVWIAVDASNNISQCSFTVNVTDVQKPNAICQDVTIQLDASGNASVTAVQVDNGSNDACDASPNLSLDITDFTCSDLGDQTVTLTVTDESGNIETCTSTVTVEDNIAPVANCQNIIVQLDASGNATITGDDIDNLSTDNCGITSKIVVPNSFDCTDIGSTVPVTLTVTDAFGNTDDCVAQVTVQDNIDPNAICKDITVQLDASGNATIVAGDIDNGSNDACGIASRTLDVSSFTCANIGANTVTLTVTDNNANVSTCTSTVTVQDNVDPVALCQDVTIQLDATGNASISTTDIDNGSSDACGIASLSLDITSFDCADLGANTVVLTVTDNNGNTSTCSATVTVQDIIDPVAICQDLTVSLNRQGLAAVSASQIDNGSSDNCSFSIKISKLEASGYGDLVTYNCSDPASQTAWLKVTDAAGNTTTCSSTLTIVDDEGPTVDDLTDRNVVADNNLCSYAHADDTWNPTDNCGTVTSMTYSLSGATSGTGSTLNGVVFNKGTTTVTWTASDNHGNNDRVTSFDIVVSDDQDPVFDSCPSNISKLVSEDGDTSVSINDVPASTYTDNCAVTQFDWVMTGATTGTGSDLSPVSGTTNPLNNNSYNIGTTTITYTVYDATGNTGTCAFTITVNAGSGAIVLSKANIITTEDLDTDSFTVKLKSAPTGTVVLDVVSDDLGEGSVDKAQLTFNAGNWSVAQTVTVTGVNDDVDDGDIDYDINLTVNKGLTDDNSGFEDAVGTLVDAVNQDNDTAGVTVTVNDAITGEDASTGSFDVVLNTEPTQNVTIDLSSNDTTEGSISGSTTLTFTPADWDTAQTVTINGVDDDIDDGNIDYSIITENTSSTDPKYSNLVVDDVSLNNVDDDTAGFVVTPLTLSTSETATSTATFTVVLTSKPATDATDYNVIVDLASGDTSEGTIDKASLTFDHTNWNIAQTVTVTSVEDILVDGDITYSINLTTDRINTTDLIYKDLAKVDDPDNVSVTNTDNDAALLSINNVSQSETNSGTTNFVFTVTHSGAEVVGGYSVSYYSQNGSAKAPSDYTGNGGPVAFTGGVLNETQTITIEVNGDLALEPDETFELVLSSVNALGRNVTIDNANKIGTGTIENDDTSELTISDPTISEGDSGVKQLVFDVTLSNPVELGVTVDYATADNTATIANSDYDAKSGMLTFVGTSGEVQTISIDINGDEVIELDESFLINLSNALVDGNVDSSISISATEGVGTGTITNDDAAVISIAGFTVNESAGTADFTITMSKAVQDVFTIDFATSDNTALTGSDYTAVTKTGVTALNFGGANALTQTVTVTILNGDVVEPTEYLYGTISNKIDAKNQAVTFFGGGASTQAIGTITDTDLASIKIDDVSVAESAGTATFTVTLTGTVQNDFTLNYSTADATAESISDYTAIAATELTFGGLNSNVQTFTVDIIENNIAEATETYSINLTDLNTYSQTGVGISDALGTGTITDNDIVNLVLNGFTVTETDGSQVQNFYVSRDIASQSPIGLLFSTTEDSAKNASDFTAQTNTAVTLISGSTDNTNIPTTILGDIIAEPQEKFDGTISLSGINGQQVVITTASATSTINDNDEMEVSLIDKVVAETNGTQSVNYVVSTNIAAEKDVVLEFNTSDGTAITTSDYTGQVNTVVTIPAGSKSVNIPINVLGDAILEPQEVFNGAISLTTDNNQQVTIADANAVYTINDNDAASIAIADVSVAENVAAGEAVFTVTLTGNIQDEFSVNYTTSDNASALDGFDYTLSSGTLTFPAGSVSGTTKSFTVAITDDNFVEPTETYTVTLSGITGGLATISDGTAVGTITDNEAASIAINDVEVAENVGAGGAVFTVTLTGNIQDALTVDFTTNDGTAHAPSDYTTVTNTVTFAAGSLNGATETITIPIIDNAIAESTETYDVDLSNIICTGSSSFTGGDSQGLGTITDDDEVTAINLAGFTNSEADANVSYNFVASMDIIAQYPVVISFTTTEGTAIAGSDFTAQSVVEYTIQPGNLSVNIPVVVIGDLINEPQEAFTGKIAIVNKNGQQITIGTDTATGTINDNDAAIVSITGFTVDEATGTADFTIALNRSVQNAISVDFETADGTAIAGSDYTAVSTTTLNFGAANANSQTVTVTIDNDDVVEPLETIIGRLSNLVNNSQDVSLIGGGASSDATGTITDNDVATLAIDDISVNESAGTATFTVTQTGTVQNAYTVDFATANSTAVEPSDYTAISTTTFTFGDANSTAQTIVVDIIENAIAEPEEEYNINLMNLIVNGQSGVSISKSQGLGTITDNDAYTISIANITVSETDSDDAHNFVATMNGTAQEDVVISFTTANSSADGTDFTAQTSQLYTILAGATSVNIPVTVLGDDIAEAQEIFTAAITISDANAQQVAIGTGGATATINDDDAHTISIADIVVSETDADASHNFVATMNGTAQEDVVISFTTANSSADGTDFTAQTNQLYTITAGSTSVNIPIVIIGDQTVESTENFTVAIAISNENSQQITIFDGNATGVINDDDSSEVSIAATTQASEPGTDGLFTLTLTNAVSVDTEITFAVSGLATEGTDYAALGTTVTIPANSTSITLP
ncbi:HYR domain-containing protein, partial [Labilibaculum sp. DW002]